MTGTKTSGPTPQISLRLWPGAVAAVLLCGVRFGLPAVIPGAIGYAVVGGLIGAMAIAVWWVFFSRAPWSERVGAIVLMILALYGTRRVVHPSIANGMIGMMLPIFAIPALGLALVAWAAAGRRLSGGPRYASMVATILLTCGVFTVLRTGGVSGDGSSDLHWRWTATPEQRLLAQAGEEAEAAPLIPTPEETPDRRLISPAGGKPVATEPPERRVGAPTGNEPATSLPVPASAESGADWPGFRGRERDGVVRGVRIETDWSRFRPVRLWRRPIGPGWSSFAVRGNLFYTQEQRGNDEIVSCYKVATGEPVWRHRDAVRFWESNGGAGPRATPTLSNGRLYTLGATGILNALDAANGAVVWSRNVVSDSNVKVPTWGFASSPLVVDELVIVAASGKLVAYDIATGTPRWLGPTHGGSYSSPHRSTLGGVTQVLLLSDAGITGVAPADGGLLWEYAWPGATIVQPALIADGDILISTSGATGGIGLRRLAVAHEPSGWTVAERWTSVGLKPYFNDLVVHKGHAFGFDGSILACIDLEDGKRTWKGGRYGNGQLVLLSDQDLLLVLSEEGELALVAATPDQYKELARFPAIEGKTWNHPALVGDVLLARSGEEIAAIRLSLAGR